jgi:hypothetical protein
MSLTFGWWTGIGLGIEVTDVWLDEDTKDIWVLLYLPGMRIGLII